MAKDPASVAAKWAANLGAATQSMQDGVNAVQTAPTQLAAARADAYVQGVQAAVNSGSWQKGLQNVSLQSWQQSMIQKGIPRVASGASQAKGKFGNFMSKLLPYQQNLHAQLSATPRGDLQQNIQRMIMWANGMSQFSKNS
jgi:hypothetical protein